MDKTTPQILIKYKKMKYTLAITIYNKEHWVESILKSWIENASDPNELEVVMVFDALKDNSKEVASQYLEKKGIKHKFLFADDKHEIFCNNLALENSTGENIIFIQDDNWIYDKNWDLTLSKVIDDRSLNVGAIALLAGARVLAPNYKEDVLKSYYSIIKHNIHSFIFKKLKPIKIGTRFCYRRIESDRSIKKENFTIHNIESQELGVWTIHHITRPFCIQRNLINKMGGLDKYFMPHMGDDIDLSYKLLINGYNNYYIPFNLLNISTVADDTKHGNLFNIHCRLIYEIKKRYPSIKEFNKKYPIKKVRELFLDTNNDSIYL